MSTPLRTLVVVREGREAVVGEAALPLTIGGRAEDGIVVPVDPSLGAVARIDLLEGEPFIQPAGAPGVLRVAGEPLTRARRLADGDRIELGACRIACRFAGDRVRLELEPQTEAGAAPAADEVIAPTPFTPHRARAGREGRARVRPLVAATWGLGAVLLLLAWFSFTAVSVQLEFEPPPDDVGLPGTWLRFQLGDRHLLRSGTHRVRAEKPGYFPFEESIEVGDDPSQRFAFTLTKLPGLLRLELTPPDGAVVTVNGSDVGTTPLDPLELAPGTHEVSLKAPRHLRATQSVEIEGAGVEQVLRLALVPAWAPIEVASEPPGAEVSVDGVAVGETPGTFDLDAGTRRIRLTLAGHAPWEAAVEVVADRPRSLETVVLRPADGRLRLTTRPPGAKVVVGGDSPGQTPLELSLASGRLHQVSLFKDGYELASRSVELEPDEERELAVTLKARMGVIDLVSTPADASLSVDGRDAGSATQQLRLLATPHALVVRKDGYREKRLTVTPRPDFAQRIEVALERAGSPAKAGGGRRTSIGQELVRVAPGSFTMGSRRGEPGRRSNESERAVELTRPFWISTHVVTNREFRLFDAKHAPAPYSGFELGGDAQPATRVSWEQAARFCNWLSRKESLPPVYAERGATLVAARPVGPGYRLPSEAEWAWAARFGAGQVDFRYPWGNEPGPKPGSGNYADASAAGIVPSALLSYRDGFPVSAPVGANGANPLGLTDVGGNVAEWVHDRYKLYPRSARSERAKDPFGPDNGAQHVIRGSGWKHASPTQLRLSYRDYGTEAREDVGFRIVRYAD